jgi:PIN domain nuclease of toxin-antitoxin system
LSGSIGSWVSETLDGPSCGTIEISHPIAIGAYSLPGDFHKDPADRLFVATARIHELTLVTMDETILRYSHVKSEDARI